MSLPETEVLTNLIARVFHVDSVTLGDPKHFFVKYNGHLHNEDSVAAYDQLDESVASYNLMPLFRMEKTSR